MKTKKELEQYRLEIPQRLQAALAACEGCDFPATQRVYKSERELFPSV